MLARQAEKPGQDNRLTARDLMAEPGKYSHAVGQLKKFFTNSPTAASSGAATGNKKRPAVKPTQGRGKHI